MKLSSLKSVWNVKCECWCVVVEEMFLQEKRNFLNAPARLSVTRWLPRESMRYQSRYYCILTIYFILLKRTSPITNHRTIMNIWINTSLDLLAFSTPHTLFSIHLFPSKSKNKQSTTNIKFLLHYNIVSFIIGFFKRQLTRINTQ